MNYDSKNPFFIYDMNKLCGICHKKLQKNKINSIHDKIPNSEPTIDALEVLQTISNFKIDNGPQNLCATCFHNTSAAYKFQTLCNIAHENIVNYFKHQNEMERNNMNGDQMNDSVKQETVELDAVTDDDGDEDEDDDDYQVEIKTEQQTNIESFKEATSKTDKVHVGPGRRIQCKVCHKLYRYDYMHVHMRVHSGEKPYKCTMCSKSFSQPTTLKFHIRNYHNNERKFMCNYCGKTFSMKVSLVVHERTHTGERPFICDLCDKGFSSKGKLKRHYIIHTTEKPFTCEFCAKSFNRSSTLHMHLKIHTNDKQHVCTICDKAFIQAHVLRNHLQMHANRDKEASASHEHYLLNC